MNFFEEIDWLNVTKADRATLYRVLRSISELTGNPVENMMEEAFGNKLLTGADYLANFRQGKIAKPKAKLIHAWIIEHHNETAYTIAPHLFPAPDKRDWEAFLETHAIKGKLRLVSLSQSKSLIRRVGEDNDASHHMKLGQPFCFELDSDVDGTMIAFQGYQDGWHPIPLGQDGTAMPTTVTSGAQLLPKTPQNQPVQMSEDEDLGLHQFVFVVNPREMTDRFPPAINDNTRVHLVKVNFAVKE